MLSTVLYRAGLCCAVVHKAVHVQFYYKLNFDGGFVSITDSFLFRNEIDIAVVLELSE